jgi:hypothetical protein
MCQRHATSLSISCQHQRWYRWASGSPASGEILRAAGIAASLAYGLGQLSNSIWKGQPGSITIKEVIDGLLYILLTEGTFGWLWPR